MEILDYSNGVCAAQDFVSVQEPTVSLIINGAWVWKPKRSWEAEKRSRLKGDKTADEDQKLETDQALISAACTGVKRGGRPAPAPAAEAGR